MNAVSKISTAWNRKRTILAAAVVSCGRRIDRRGVENDNYNSNERHHVKSIGLCHLGLSSREPGMQPSDPITDEIYVELVDNIFTSIPPIVTVGLSLIALAAAASWSTGDSWTAFIGALTACVLVVRIAIVLAFRRRSEPNLRSTAEHWERLYAAGAWIFSTLFAALSIRLMVVGDEAWLFTSLCVAMAYPSGVIVRVSLRPWIAMPQIAIALVPIAIAAPTLGGPKYLLFTALVAGYLIASHEMVGYLFRSTVERLASRHELSRQTRVDVLTGLSNRRHFEERLTAVGDRATALLCLDLDGFKAVNDDYGHEAGDELLRQVAGRLRGAVRAADVVARLGGDEFVIICAGPDAKRLAERLIQTVGKPYVVDSVPVTIGVSIGVASALTGEATAEFVKRADAALYQAKRGGRGRLALAA